MCPQPPILHLDSDQPAQFYILSAYFAISFRKKTASLTMFNRCHQTNMYHIRVTCKQPAPNLRPLSARQRNAFRMVFFWRADSGPILRAYWELVNQFLSLHVFIPRPRLWRGARGNKNINKSDLVYQHFSVNRDIPNMVSDM